MNNILGVKLTHDGALAGIRDDQLLFCVEAEKINNGSRYAKWNWDAQTQQVLHDFDFTPDCLVVDGWKGQCAQDITGTATRVQSYHEFDINPNQELSKGLLLDDPVLGGFISYPHIASHVFGAYATSPWARARKSCYVITWDGGQNPRVHYIEPDRKGKQVQFVGVLHNLYGFIYSTMGRYFGPFRYAGIENMPVEIMSNTECFGGYDLPGKLMSLIALAPKQEHDVRLRLSESLPGIYQSCEKQWAKWLHGKGRSELGYNQDGQLEHLFLQSIYREVKRLRREYGQVISDISVLLVIHTFLEMLLVERLKRLVPKNARIIFAGGSALNIKWNSALRCDPHFTAVWVPPFPNDSGSAIGTACAYNAMENDCWHLHWNVYAGPHMRHSDVPAGWACGPASPMDVATVLASEEPVLVLDGRAELGPRALGNRSILASPRSGAMKDILNSLKQRESFRPVAPICLEEMARGFFDPGIPDPYMLYDHHCRTACILAAPAVVHVDGTARLQTVAKSSPSVTRRILEAFCELTGVPILCNTSANLHGSGFFPDLRTAMLWGKVGTIYSEGFLYRKQP